MKIVIGRILFGLLWAAAALWMARVCLAAIRARRAWREEGVVVDGEIVGFEERKDTNPSDRRPLFAPIVTFKTMEGAPMRFTSSRAERPNPYTVGQTIAVRYKRLTPTVADLDAATKSVMLIVVPAVLGIVALGVVLLTILMPMPKK